MPKIKLHTILMQDISYFDVVYNQVDIVFHDNINDIFEYDLIVLNRTHVLNNLQKCKEYLNKSLSNRLILLDVTEGTNTTNKFLIENNLIDYFLQTKQIFIISSGDFSKDCVFANVDIFLYMVASNKFNIISSLNHFQNIYDQKNKCYSFLFLNKFPRYHREKLIVELGKRNLLDKALWSDLSNNIKLPSKIEDHFNDNIKNIFTIKMQHDLSWVDGMISPQLYTETYFTVVTETNFEIPHNYCTEKIYKPILMGHPFVAVSSYKFYQHLKDRGYKTFGHLIDESFDDIENNEDRLLAIVNSIETLCQQNLDDFLLKVKPICEHNRLNFLREVGEHDMFQFETLTTFLKKVCLN